MDRQEGDSNQKVEVVGQMKDTGKLEQADSNKHEKKQTDLK